MAATHNCVTRTSVKVRPAPNTSNTSVGGMSTGAPFQISAILPDSLDPTNTAKKWGKIFGGQYDSLYTALEYPGNISPISTYTPIPTTEVPPTPTEPTFPESFVLVDPSGARANYIFDKVLEE